MSVTSSGLSSIRRTINSTFGWFLAILFATFFSKLVLPALGGATINPLCPLPIGDIKSISLVAISLWLLSKVNLSSGYIGVNNSNAFLCIAVSGFSSFIFWTYKRALNFSPVLGCLVIPFTLSPVFILNLLIWDGDTYTSPSVDK